jgi:GPH family glycoside/pentoside/hexuronide:cation symporter
MNEMEIEGHSKFIMASYGCRELFGNWIAQAFGFMVFFFYEVVVGLDVVLAAFGFLLYSVWNAVNDPLVAYLTERFHMPWEKKWNLRRFPWIIIGALPWLLTFSLIFMVPAEWDPISDPNDNWPVFFWFVITMCIYDTTLTTYDVNVLSVYPEKFQDLDERRTVQGFGTILGIISLVLAATIPPMFITTGVRETYQTAALVSTGLGFIIFLFMIPGVWEDKKMRKMNLQRRETLKDVKTEPFLKVAKSAITNRNFAAKVTLFFGYQVGAVMLQYSAFYIVVYLLDEEASFITYLLGAMLIGALVSVPVWLYLSHKIDNNKKLSVVGAIIMFFTFIPMIFVADAISWIIVLFFFGIGLGGQWFTDPPTLADVIDDAAVREGKKAPGIYFGYQAFFIRLGYSTIAITIAIVHVLTGFVGGAPSLKELRERSPTPDLALFGIRIHAAIVPAILIFITILIFWKYYELTPDKVAANRAKLKELGLL